MGVIAVEVAYGGLKSLDDVRITFQDHGQNALRIRLELEHFVERLLEAMEQDAALLTLALEAVRYESLRRKQLKYLSP